MNARNKSALVIVCTLLAGIAVGVLATNFVVNRRIEQMRELRSQRGYMGSIVDTIQPTSEAQREVVEEILRHTHDQMNELRRDWSRGMRAEGDSMRIRLREVLSADQNEQLDAWFARYQRPRRNDDNRSRTRSRSDSSRSDSNRQPSSDRK